MRPFYQCAGDMNPAGYGGTFYRVTDCGTAIELIEIQPVIEYIGEREARELDGAFWVKTTYVDGDDFNRLIGDPGFRSYCGLNSVNVPLDSAPGVASICAADSGYGLLGWDQEGNMSGADVARLWWLRGMDGKTLRPDLIDADREFRANKRGE